jgi:hypothetical protein
MLCLTSKLLSDVDDPLSPADTATSSALGDWYGHIFVVDRKKCILFINEPTLFVSLACGVVKADYRKIVPFFLQRLEAALRNEGFGQKQIAYILKLHRYVGIGKTSNRTTVGALNNRIADTKTIVTFNGGFANCDLGEISRDLNTTPMKPIGYKNGLEQMRALVGESQRGRS